MTDPPDHLEEAEIFILNERPATAADAVCILDVVYANGGDPRSDGLENEALGRIRRFLWLSARSYRQEDS